ncbi:MAG: pyridoxal phosphate-dependent aminotransferase [Betaproteobacteria bacterium]|nr:pyridoxal phosphate-dependent aminotransferase [Betaproteobacteria bacterium]
MTTFLSRRVASVQPPMTREMTRLGNELARAGRSIMSLAQGEPDFDTPLHVREAGKAAIDAGKTRYTDVPGTRELTAAIMRKFERDNGIAFKPGEITIGVGSKQVLYNALQATVDPGDEVVVAVPAWVSYPEMVRLAEGVPVIVPCPAASGFKITPQQLQAAITPRTKWLMLNSPSNPSGAEYTREELQALAEVLLRHPHVWLMSDDIYEKIRYLDTPFPTMAAVVPEMASRCLTINGVSKAFAMTGWRCGYGAGPAELIRGINLVQGQSVSHTSSISQAAAVAALDGPMDFLPPFVAAYRRRRDLVVAAMRGIEGVECTVPDGAFYVFPGCHALLGRRTPKGKLIATDMDLCMYFLEEAGVALVPGSAFELAGHFRISYAASDATLEEGMKRLKEACGNLG